MFDKRKEFCDEAPLNPQPRSVSVTMGCKGLVVGGDWGGVHKMGLDEI